MTTTPPSIPELSTKWVCWEGREEDKKLDKFWSDTYLRLFSVDSYARFWLGYQHLPQPGTMFKVRQGVARPRLARSEAGAVSRTTRESRVKEYAFFKESVKPFKEFELEGCRVNRSRWSLEADVRDADTARVFNKVWENLMLFAMSGDCDQHGILNGVRIVDKSSKSVGGCFRIELWFKTGNQGECKLVADSLSAALKATVSGFGLDFTSLAEANPPKIVDALYDMIDVRGIVTDLLPGAEILSSGPLASGMLEGLFRARVVLPRGQRSLLLRVLARNPAHLPVEAALIAKVASTTTIPVSVVLASAASPVPVIISERVRGEPLSAIWPSLTFDQRKPYLTQLVAFVTQLAKAFKYPSVGTLGEGLEFIPDVFEPRSSAIAAAGGSAVTVEPLVGYYQKAVDAKYTAIKNDVRGGDLGLALVSRLQSCCDRDIPAWCAGYTGGFCLALTGLRLHHILVDKDAAKIVCVSGWDTASVVSDEDALNVVTTLCDVEEEAAFVAAAAAEAHFPSHDNADKRQPARRLLTLCDRLLDHRIWAVMPAARQEEMFKATLLELKTKYSPIGGK